MSRNDETMQALETLIHKTHFLPTLILDREFDAYSIIRHLCRLRQKFIIRITKKRKFRVPGESIKLRGGTHSREEMIGKYAFLSAQEWITYGKQGEIKKHLFEFKAAYIELLSERKKSEEIRDQELSHIARSYLARWNIEEYIRFIKQHFAIEGFLVRDLGRMKNLISATYIAIVIIHLLTDRRTNLGFKTHHRLLQQSLPVGKPRKTRDFFLYSYGAGLSNIVSLNKKLFEPAKTGLTQSEIEDQLKF
jgi:hypothetical protein